MIRTDLDALPVTEATELPFASKVVAKDAKGHDVGVMHACGHDVHITCQKHGESVHGTYGTSSLWDHLASGGYVADAYVSTGSDGRVAPLCP